MELRRDEKLKALQIGYQKWVEKYPQENEDDADSHLMEMQENEIQRILAEKKF
jgi:hypothetical protein